MTCWPLDVCCVSSEATGLRWPQGRRRNEKKAGGQGKMKGRKVAANIPREKTDKHLKSQNKGAECGSMGRELA